MTSLSQTLNAEIPGNLIKQQMVRSKPSTGVFVVCEVLKGINFLKNTSHNGITALHVAEAASNGKHSKYVATLSIMGVTDSIITDFLEFNA